MHFVSYLLSSCKLSSTKIDTLISKLPSQELAKPDETPKVKNATIKRIVDSKTGIAYDYQEETASYTKLFNDQSLINADYSLIYPGALVSGKFCKAKQSRSSFINNKSDDGRCKYFTRCTIYEKGVDCNSGLVVNTAVNKILIGAKTGYRTNFYSKTVITNSFEDAMFKLDLNADWISGSLKASMATNNSKSSENVYFLLKDEYYQAFCEQPRVPSDLFKGRLYKSDERHFDPTDQPLLIESVTYGRMILLKSSISTETLKKEYSASIEQDFGSASADVNLFMSSLSKHGMTDIEVLAYGGYKSINVGDKPIIDYLKRPSLQKETYPHHNLQEYRFHFV